MAQSYNTCQKVLFFLTFLLYTRITTLSIPICLYKGEFDATTPFTQSYAIEYFYYDKA